MKIEDLIVQPSVWLGNADDSDVIVSSRVRLARNIRGEAFPHKARVEDSVRLWERLQSAICGLPSMDKSMSVEMDSLSWTYRHVLRERHLISIEQSEKGKGSGLILKHDESIAIMVNEEDHLRMQALSSGLALKAIWQKIDEVDSELEQNVNYAFSRRLGYLTACPSNVGTGLRASAMLHLPALNLLNEMGPVIKGLTRIGLAVRGLLGEGTEASGNMFQISNQTTLGESEASIVERLTDVVTEVAGHEKNARVRLAEQRKVFLKDYVGRAYGVMVNAHLLSSRELLDLLSAMRLGVDVGIVRNVSMPLIHELMLLTQPGHMQMMAKRELSPEERDQMRAQVTREKFKKLSIEI